MCTVFNVSTFIHRVLPIAQARFKLNPAMTDHGIAHWVRVWRNAKELCDFYKVEQTVPLCFAFLHDSCRENDFRDPDHGPRAAEFAETIFRQNLLKISAYEFHLLATAIHGHTTRKTSTNLLTQICWDADRLDLGRVGIIPDPKLLCTEYARRPEVIAAAYRRSTSGLRLSEKQDRV